MNTTKTEPTIDQIIAAVGGKPSRDGKSVVVSYGYDGYLRVTPSSVIDGDTWLPAAYVDGRLNRRSGSRKSELRDKLRASNIYPR